MKHAWIAVILAGALCIMCNKDSGKDKWPVVGGFHQIEITSPEAVKGVDFLKKELAKKQPGIKELQLEQAESQVVAGYNLKLLCRYAEDNAKEKKRLRATIYVDLDGKYTLTDLTLDVKEPDGEDTRT